MTGKDTLIMLAKRIFDYLYLRDADCRAADIIIGFGHFDLRIPQTCGALYTDDVANRILFTGGHGSGSADLRQAEGTVFQNVLRKEYPQIPDSHVYVESESTHTGENVQMSAALLQSLNGEFCFEKGIVNVAAVASPYRQRRVCRTIQKYYPNITVFNMPPKSTFEYEMNLFNEKNQDFTKILLGEMDRIRNYSRNGFMKREQIPKDISEADTHLRMRIKGA